MPDMTHPTNETGPRGTEEETTVGNYQVLLDSSVKARRTEGETRTLVVHVRAALADYGECFGLFDSSRTTLLSTSPEMRVLTMGDVLALADAVESQAAELERLRARVAEYDKLAIRAAAGIRLEVPSTEMAHVARSLAALAPEGDKVGGG